MRIVLRDKRQITLPAEVCKELGLEPGSQLDLHVEGQQIVLKPSGLRVLDALEEISRALKEAGVTEEEWMESGREIRKEIFRETYPELAEKYGI
jgi:AbrB family looped-hinge helix DNA binding protein